MENKKKVNLIKGTLVAGVLLSSSVLSASPGTSNLFEYNTLGSGAEVRSEILSNHFDGMKNLEAKCGEKEKETEGKKAEAKCGEGKCGEKDKKAEKTDEKEAEATKAKKAESKSKEAKCGEGKCGDE